MYCDRETVIDIHMIFVRVKREHQNPFSGSQVLKTNTHLQRAVLGAGVQLEVMDADGCDDMSLPPGVTGAVRERHLVIALTRPQQTQVLSEN